MPKFKNFKRVAAYFLRKEKMCPICSKEKAVGEVICNNCKTKEETTHAGY